MTEDAKKEETGGFDISPLQLALLALFVVALSVFVAMRSFSQPVHGSANTSTTTALKDAKKKAVLPTIVPASQNSLKY